MEHISVFQLLDQVSAWEQELEQHKWFLSEKIRHALERKVHVQEKRSGLVPLTSMNMAETLGASWIKGVSEMVTCTLWLGCERQR